MKTTSKVTELQKILHDIYLSPSGFVPTMGALHEGHLSLVRSAMEQAPLVIVSIYVNPTQFNDIKDLENYPRMPENDMNLLGKILRENDIVFTPDDKEIYPEKDNRVFDFGNLGKVMEAVNRPGHFNGVAQVVSRLFEIVKPDIAFFGMKDFQQLAVIRELVRKTGDKVRIVGNPIIRERDGLAMSSRNLLLEPQIRKEASVIYRTLTLAAGKIKSRNIPEIKAFVRDSINKVPGFVLEYFEIVDDKELVPVKSRDEMRNGSTYYGCIALRAGKIRLIDNIEIGLV